jgi:hypothetical protein
MDDEDCSFGESVAAEYDESDDTMFDPSVIQFRPAPVPADCPNGGGPSAPQLATVDLALMPDDPGLGPAEEAPATKPPVTVTIERADLPAVEAVLLKAKASELSDLRRAQTQLAVYGDRRSGMEGEPAAIEARLEILSDLLHQIEKQRSRDGD